MPFGKMALCAWWLLTCSVAWCLEAPEYQLKAVYLYNFVKFTNWPRTIAEGASFHLCIIGADPFAGDLESLTTGKDINGRSVKVLHLQVQEDFSPCSVAFVGSAERESVPNILRKLRTQSALSVGETPEFLDQGGMIRFMLDKDRLAFEINLPAVQKAGLRIDARVLRLAKLRK